MISTSLARQLRDAGLRWKPASGDRFQIDRAELDGDVFTVSDLTIEPHEYATGTVLGFNGTTEWALDSVAVEDALWLPREDQLRNLLRGAFLRLERDGDDYRVVLRARETSDDAASDEAAFTSVSAPEAYGLALLSILERVSA